ncbi:hypothetical protein [Vibrio sp. SCSIO 43155]|uniref:hypothetical protein n=1 Tax=Vibrio sp. SCSIO 43155 TaxID=2819099 RepID=UPI002074E8AA|nr:hypothetical protein [Vibrio sp. SCSIO 43155]USD58609.1 hypothetical protein J4N44_27030 [Vibrio sp. SCSIO 43155]
MGNRNLQHSAEQIEQGTVQYNQCVSDMPGRGMSFDLHKKELKGDAKEALERKLEESL